MGGEGLVLLLVLVLSCGGGRARLGQQGGRQEGRKWEASLGIGLCFSPAAGWSRSRLGARALGCNQKEWGGGERGGLKVWGV